MIETNSKNTEQTEELAYCYTHKEEFLKDRDRFLATLKDYIDNITYNGKVANNKRLFTNNKPNTYTHSSLFKYLDGIYENDSPFIDSFIKDFLQLINKHYDLCFEEIHEVDIWK